MLNAIIPSLHHPLPTAVPNARHAASAGPAPSGVTERASNSTSTTAAVFQTAADIPPSLISFPVFVVQRQRNTTRYTVPPVLPPSAPPPASLHREHGRAPGGEKTSCRPVHLSQSQGGTEDDTIRPARASQMSPSGLLSYCKAPWTQSDLFQTISGLLVATALRMVGQDDHFAAWHLPKHDHGDITHALPPLLTSKIPTPRQGIASRLRGSQRAFGESSQETLWLLGHEGTDAANRGHQHV